MVERTIRFAVSALASLVPQGVLRSIRWNGQHEVGGGERRRAVQRHDTHCRSCARASHMRASADRRSHLLLLCLQTQQLALRIGLCRRARERILVTLLQRSAWWWLIRWLSGFTWHEERQCISSLRTRGCLAGMLTQPLRQRFARNRIVMLSGAAGVQATVTRCHADERGE